MTVDNYLIESTKDGGCELISSSLVVLYSGDLAKLKPLLLTELNQLGVELNYFKAPEGLLSIDAIRELQNKFSLRRDARVIYLVEATKLPLVSQNALLKLLEETTGDKSVILVLPAGVELIPTVLSRVQVKAINTKVSEIFTNFLTMPTTERLNLWGNEIDQDNVGLLHKYLLDQTGDNVARERLLIVREGWQRGSVAPKYFYEFMCLLEINPDN